MFLLFLCVDMGNRYNKSLLGDKLGKFPAPLLMNTVHFAMQAVLSKVITGFWHQRFQPTVMMSWRDYSLKGNIMTYNSIFSLVTIE